MRVMIYKSNTSLSEVSEPTLHWLSDRIVDHCSCNTKHAFIGDTKTSNQIHDIISYVWYAISHRHVLYYIWPLGSDIPCDFVYFKTLGQSPYKSLTRFNNAVLVALFLVLCVACFDRCLSFFFWPLCCLSFDFRFLITPSVSSNSS